MNTKSAIILLFFSFSLILCSSPYHPEYRGGKFSIYLLKDENFSSQQAQEMDINDLELADEPWITTEDIEFYDFSTHCIYLKKERPAFHYYLVRPFIVVASNTRIYLGSFFSMFSSSPVNTLIIKTPFFYPDDIIRIEKTFASTQDVPDMRNDYRIKYALERHNIFTESISVKLDNAELIGRADTSTVAYSFTITNIGKLDLYVPDPEKMGPGLFNYYTTQPRIYNENLRYYPEYDSVEYPESYKSWDISWYTKLCAGRSIRRYMVIKGYPYIENGSYKCNFTYDSPRWIEKNDRILTDGRIWIGEIESNTINIKIGN